MRPVITTVRCSKCPTTFESNQGLNITIWELEELGWLIQARFSGITKAVCPTHARRLDPDERREYPPSRAERAEANWRERMVARQRVLEQRAARRKQHQKRIRYWRVTTI